MRGRVSLAAGSAALLLAATGCVGPFADEPAATSTTAQDRADRQLDETSAELALPIVGDLPAGVGIHDTPPSDIASQRTEPDGCLDANVNGAERAKLGEHQVVEVERDYTHQTKYGSAGVTIRSYDVEVPDALFTAAGEAVGRCSPMKRFTTFEGESEEVVDTVSVSGLSVPRVGDQTFASRFTLTDSTEPASKGGVLDYLAFKRGHNLVTVVYFVGPRSERVEDLPSKLAAIVDRNLSEG